MGNTSSAHVGGNPPSGKKERLQKKHGTRESRRKDVAFRSRHTHRSTRRARDDEEVDHDEKMADEPALHVAWTDGKLDDVLGIFLLQDLFGKKNVMTFVSGIQQVGKCASMLEAFGIEVEKVMIGHERAKEASHEKYGWCDKGTHFGILETYPGEVVQRIQTRADGREIIMWGFAPISAPSHKESNAFLASLVKICSKMILMFGYNTGELNSKDVDAEWFDNSKILMTSTRESYPLTDKVPEDTFKRLRAGQEWKVNTAGCKIASNNALFEALCSHHGLDENDIVELRKRALKDEISFLWKRIEKQIKHVNSYQKGYIQMYTKEVLEDLITKIVYNMDLTAKERTIRDSIIHRLDDKKGIRAIIKAETIERRKRGKEIKDDEPWVGRFERAMAVLKSEETPRVMEISDACTVLLAKGLARTHTAKVTEVKKDGTETIIRKLTGIKEVGPAAAAEQRYGSGEVNLVVDHRPPHILWEEELTKLVKTFGGALPDLELDNVGSLQYGASDKYGEPAYDMEVSELGSGQRSQGHRRGGGTKCKSRWTARCNQGATTYSAEW